MDEFDKQFQEHFSNKTLKTPTKKYVGSYEKGRTLWAAFDMTYDGLMQRCPDAVKLLHLMIFLSPGSIPSILGNKFELENAAFDTSVFGTDLVAIQSFDLIRWLNELRWDVERFGAATNELESSGFVKLGRNRNDASIESLAVHAIIRTFICSRRQKRIFTRV